MNISHTILKLRALAALVLLLPLASSAADGYTFTTVAGRKNVGNVDGIGSAAQFYEPAGIASDANGNLYVIDAHTHTLRKISPSAEVATVAGLASTYGTTDGIGSSARFSFAQGIAVTANGVIYIADTGNNAVRKVTPDFVVTTVAGGRKGSLDGLGMGASFDGLTGIAVDEAGNMYVTDTNNHIIRKVDPNGIVTTIAGTAGESGAVDGSAAAARFNGPKGIAIDPSGNLYVADTSNSTIRRITPAGVVTTLAGAAGVRESADGTGASAHFYEPTALAVDAVGNVHVVEASGFLRRISPAGVVTSPIEGLSFPRGVAVDASTGSIFVADTGNRLIKKVTLGGSVSTFAGNTNPVSSLDGIGTDAQFSTPRGLAFDPAGNLFVADSNAHAIRRITPELFVTMWAGNFITYSYGAVDGQGASAAFANPMAIASDATGNLFVADFNSTIRQIDPQRNVITLAGAHQSNGSLDGPRATARFHSPSGIAVDGAGNIYVADTFNETIRKVDTAGQVSTPFGQIGTQGAVDGVASAARFFAPAGLAFDQAGNLYVADSANYAVRKISPTGVVTTLAGSLNRSGSSDGKGNEARFGELKGIALDRDGNIFVTENTAHTVRRITPDGTVTTIGGVAGSPGIADGAGSSARFNQPWGIAVDKFGHIWIADSQNNTIRKGVMPGAKPPVFISHPVAKAVGAGREATFTVAAGGPPAPLYQWERRAVGAEGFTPLTEGAGFSDVTTATLRITSPTVAMSGDQYRCVANNGLLPTATSNAATLTVTPPPVFTSLATATFAVGVEGDFSVAATGATEFKIASGSLPSWATLDATTGRITGQPPEDAEGPYTFVIHATNAAVEPTAQSFTLEIDPGPTLIVVPVARTTNAGSTTILHADVAGRAPITYRWSKGGVALIDSPRVTGATTATLTISKTEAADSGVYSLVATGPAASATVEPFQLTVANPPTITTQPVSQTIAAGERADFSVVATSSSPISFQWYFNGTAISGATGSAHSIDAASHSSNGYYAVRVFDAVTSVMSELAMLTVVSTDKVAGTATEVGPDITHQNGRIYDQVLLTGAAGTFRADPGQVLRVSCVDLNDDIVQIEFAGAGTLHVRLENATGPANPAHYNQAVQYMRGHPSISIAGADDSTYLTIFTVGSITALNQTLFRGDVTYDGMADIGLVSISSSNGKFGGIFSGNASYWNTTGVTGIYAPGVEFVAPVVVGEISGADSAQAVLVLGSAADVRVAGGNLAQMNHQPVQIDGVTKLSFTAGANSHGVARAPQVNQARLERDHTDVTTDIVLNPTP